MTEESWLEAFSVPRPSPTEGLADEFEKLLNDATSEEEIQRFLTANPFILAEQLPHCHHVIPKFRFGGKYVSDYLLPEMTSGGTFWTLVELEPANAQLVTASGHLGERVRGGVQQVKDWRDWLLNNLDHAIRPRDQDGLGLDNMAGIWGWVIVGRRSMVTGRFNQLRKQIWDDSKITIMTYDRVLEWYRRREEHWQAWDAQLQAWADSNQRPVSASHVRFVLNVRVPGLPERERGFALRNGISRLCGPISSRLGLCGREMSVDAAERSSSDCRASGSLAMASSI
ncbi:Shedu anti-phage system protein SduA domain-containing protein [Methyloceanibacter stevinii]|uniref:Shedu anti-phage system protein SduA domain-containing protein n=1 Tax=Methyloceanibacter stevinii TaxID=1774970 RepID=UPI003CC7A305